MGANEPEADQYEVETDMLGRMARPFIVAAPASYIVDLQHASDSPDAERLRLVSMVGELRSYLRELGIGEAQAQAAGYSLNMVTWDGLQDSAMHLGASSDLWRRMRAGTWQR